MRKSRKQNPELQQRIEAVRREARANLREQQGRLRDRIAEARRNPSETMLRVQAATARAARPVAPLGRLIGSGLRAIAPAVSGGLLALFRIPVALVALTLDLTQEAGHAVGSRAQALAARVRPVGTVAAVIALAAVALAGSQFAEYRGVAVGSPQYSGEVGTVAPAPLTELKTAGSAHYYALLGVTALVLLTLVPTLRGRWRFGRIIGLLGAVVVAVSILVDAPKGLDAGTAGIAYDGTSAELIEGFWAQIAAGAAIFFCGPLLGRYVKLTGPSRSEAPSEVPAQRRERERDRRRRKAAARQRPTRPETA